MALSSGTRQAAAMAAGWVFAACCGAFSLLYFSEIKEGTRGLLGSPDASAVGLASDGSRHAGRDRSAGSGRVVELKAGAYGHYYTDAEINGRPVGIVVDTGASHVALTAEDARQAGIFIRDSDYTHRVNTANGQARVAPIVLDRVSIGSITVRNVPASVSEPGKLGTSLLGMSFLGRLQRVEMRPGLLVLQE